MSFHRKSKGKPLYDTFFFEILLVTRKYLVFLNDLIHLRNAHLMPTFKENRFVHNSNQRIIPQALCEEGLYRFY